MSLHTGVEMISLSMLFNRIAGLYGLLAILTGFRLNVTQLSMYLYSVVALILLAFLMPHIRKRSPLECLAFAWFYLIDTVVNCAYTAAFAVTWFLTVNASSSEFHGGVPSGAPGSGTINDTAGFTSLTYNVTKVEVVASPSADAVGGLDAGAIGKAATDAVATASTNLQHGVKNSIPSLVIIIALTLIRIYFIFIVMAYARQILSQFVQDASTALGQLHSDGISESETRNPFAPNMPLGQGLRGKLGRIMVFVGKNYFLDAPIDDGWARGVNSRFKSTTVTFSNEQRGTFERERRARSGTGPPQPPPDLTKMAT
jgi:hypothetical protein